MQKEIIKTYKYRLYPTKIQEELLSKHFGCVRFVYNRFLFERKEQYQKTGKSKSYYEQSKALTILKKEENYKWLNTVNSQTLQQALRHLEKAYTSFFRNNTGFPKFKKKNNRNSFNIPPIFTAIVISILALFIIKSVTNVSYGTITSIISALY